MLVTTTAGAHQETANEEGWNNDPVCKTDASTDGQRCWTLTKGFSAPGVHVADLGYACTDSGREMVGVSFNARKGAAFTGRRVVLAVRWDERAVRSLPSVPFALGDSPRRSTRS